MLTLEQLVTPVTEDEALDTMLTVLGQLGFQATSWQSGAIQLTILRLFAKTWSAFSSTVAAIASGGFTTLATKNWLTLLAKYVYGLDRIAAQPTIGTMTLTASAGAPVTTFSAGDVIVADQPSGTPGAHVYTCTTGGTLGPSSSLQVTFKADTPGTAANIPPSTTLYLWTPLVGITVTNPVLGVTGTWITTPGSDDESDARLTARCIGRWSQLTYGNNDGAYVFWALTALPSLTRVSVATAAGDGNVKLIGATSLGPISGGQITTITNYINGTTDGVGRKPINDILTVVGATTLSSPSLTVDVYVRPDVVTSIAGTVTQALLNYFGSIPIGGVRLIVGSVGIVPFTRMVQIVQDLDGVRKCAFSIGADITLASDQIYTPTITVNVHQVAPGT